MFFSFWLFFSLLFLFFYICRVKKRGLLFLKFLLRLFFFQLCFRLCFLLLDCVLLASLNIPHRKFKIDAHKFNSCLKLRLLQEGTDCFASKDVVKSKRPLKSNSDCATFWHELILESLGNQPSFIVSWWDTLVLEELHLLHNFDRLL